MFLKSVVLQHCDIWGCWVFPESIRYNWASEASPTLGCLIKISRDIYICRYVCRVLKCVGGITGTHAHTRVIHFDYKLNTTLAGTKKNLHISVEIEEERGARFENVAAAKRLRLAMETYEERKSRLEKMVATAQLMLALIKVWSMWVLFYP